MSFEATLDGLKNTKWWEYLLRFVFGGIITAVAGWVAHRFGPLVGGLFLAFPSIAPATATLVNRHDGRDAAVDSSYGAIGGAIGLIAFGAVIVSLSAHTSTVVVLVVASAAWAIVSVAAWAIAATVHGRWHRREQVQSPTSA